MGKRRWFLGRVLLIWCAWPLLLTGIVVALVLLGHGGSLDLAHPSGRALVGAMLLGPPLVATIAWGRQ